MSPTASEPIPRLYALHRDDDEDGPPTVVAWGLAFADGSAVTLWTDPYPGVAIAVSGSLRTVEERYARYADAYLTWPTGVELEESRGWSGR
jgi:hypothetical protein